MLLSACMIGFRLVLPGIYSTGFCIPSLSRQLEGLRMLPCPAVYYSRDDKSHTRAGRMLLSHKDQQFCAVEFAGKQLSEAHAHEILLTHSDERTLCSKLKWTAGKASFQAQLDESGLTCHHA